jgi:hypothetical protein
MPQKIILTEEQHYVVINHMLREMVEVDPTMNEEMIDEGMWEKIKYGLSKLGRYKAGGKVFGKGKIDQEAAAKIQQIIDKKGNETIKALDADIKQKNPEFPNNEKGAEFLNTIMEISAVYDSVIAATKKGPKDEGYLPIDAANGIINDLREYVKKFLDVDLTAAYSVVDEAEGNVVELSEEELKSLDESFGIDPNEDDDENKEDKEEPYDVYSDETADFGAGVKKGYRDDEVDEDAADDTRKALQAKKGTGKDFDSDRMKGLKSNKLPLLLAGIGGSMGGLSWLAKTEWFKHWLEGLLGADHTVTTPEITQQITGGAPDSKGFLNWAGNIDGHPMKTGADVQGFIDKYGAENVKHMFDGNGGGSPDTQIQQLQQLVGGDNASKPVGQLFNPSNDTFGSMKGAQNLFGVSKAASFLGQIVVKKATSTLVKGAGTALATKFAGLAGVLGPIGIGVMAAGALVKIMRLKGQRQSRAKTLNDLYQSMRNIEGGAGIIEPEGPTDKDKKDGGGDKGQGGDGGFNDDLYNSLLNLFRFVVTSNKKFGAGATDGGGEAAPEEGGSLKPGTKVTWTTAKGNKATGTVSDKNSGNPKITIVNINGDPAKSWTVATKKLSKIGGNLQEGLMSEAKYFRDKELVKYLNKNISPDRVKEFENFLNRIEQIRNKLRNMKSGDDKVFNQKLETFKQNPIILTDFNKMFNLSSANPQAYENLAKFINDIFKTVYTGKFKKGDLMDKLAGMGKVGAKNIDEAEAQFKRTQIEKDAQDRGKFKKHLMQFMTDAIGLFQYMFQQKKNMAAKGGQQQNTNKQAAKLGIKSKPDGKGGSAGGGGGAGASADDTSDGGGDGGDGGASDEPKPFKPATYESVNGQNKMLTEEIERIKKIMGSLI